MIDISSDKSISGDVFPSIKNRISEKGYSILTVSEYDNERELRDIMVCSSVLIGEELSDRVTVALLEGTGDSEVLPVHTEGIYGKDGICPFFSLGCMIPADSGGATRIYDGRKAAAMLKERHPSVANARIHYRSLSYPDEGAEYPVAHSIEGSGDVLRFRDDVVSNDFISSDEYPSKDKVYNAVNNVLRDCIILEHEWNKGDLLFVNNKITLHDRKPYSGKRVLVRVRMNEPSRTTLTY